MLNVFLFDDDFSGHISSHLLFGFVTVLCNSLYMANAFDEQSLHRSLTQLLYSNQVLEKYQKLYNKSLH